MLRIPPPPAVRIALALIAVVSSIASLEGHASAQDPLPAQQWLRLDPLPGEMRLTPRESFDGVPPRFVVLTDGTVFVGGRRVVMRGSLGKGEMQSLATRLDVVMKSLGQTALPQTLVEGEGPAIFRFSVLLGSPLQVVVMGHIPETGVLAPLPDFVRRLAGFRHPSLRPVDTAEFKMIVREKTLAGGCRASRGLPPLSQAVSSDVVVPQSLTRGFPTGADISQVCEGSKRYTVVFRPLIPGER